MTGQRRNPQVATWVGWHAAELAALGLPAVLALSVSVWFWLVVAVAAGGWAAHELRQQRRRRALRTDRPPQQLATTQTSEQTQTDEQTQTETTPRSSTARDHA